MCRMSLSDDVKTRARELGFVAVGATTAEPFTQAEAAALARTEQGLMGGLPWGSAPRGGAGEWCAVAREGRSDPAGGGGKG